MGNSSKIFWALATLALVGIVCLGVRTRNRWVAQDERFRQALAHRQERVGEPGQVARETMEDMKRAMPAPDPATERKMEVLTSAAPGSPPAIAIMMNPESVKTMPQAQRDAALQTMLGVANAGEREERAMAIEALGRMGDTRAIYRLCQLANDQDALISDRANRALANLGYRR
ncbi:MAG TPA: HEAT repeat domain-containing protein [Armatimonadota bacterium]|jgi:hypothetical protein